MCFCVREDFGDSLVGFYGMGTVGIVPEMPLYRIGVIGVFHHEPVVVVCFVGEAFLFGLLLAAALVGGGLVALFYFLSRFRNKVVQVRASGGVGALFAFLPFGDGGFVFAGVEGGLACVALDVAATLGCGDGR